MSDEMAVSDNVAGDQPQVQSEDSSGDGAEDNLSHPSEAPTDSLATNTEDASVSTQEMSADKEDVPKSKEDDIDNTTVENSKAEVHIDIQNNLDKSEKANNEEESVNVKLENTKETIESEEKLDDDEMDTDENTEIVDIKIKEEPLPQTEIKVEVQEEVKTEEQNIGEIEKHIRRGIKRRASEALSDGPEDFKGFDLLQQNSNTGEYGRILERLEAEVSAATKDFKPLRYVIATPMSTLHASKRPRKDTDGSRPSSAMSSRSDETNENVAMSPMQRGRRSTMEMSSPLLRVPLERGWKRELVYRAALDAHSRRHADIYYYMPSGKKLRSTREVAEHLSGTGLTLENFSFFKEPLGVDDPEKEIIRDAKLIRRVESPVVAAPPVPVEGKRTPKPKPPKGASPEPATPKSPPAKIKVKSMGSRLSGSAPAPVAAPATKQPRRQQQSLQQQQQQSPAAQNNADNNNTAPWKKPRAPEPLAPAPASALAPGPGLGLGPAAPRRSPPPTPPQPPPPLLSRPPLVNTSPDAQARPQVVQPCSMSCGRGAVPSLSCAACLCLYHPACAGYTHSPQPFLCANCYKVSPPLEPPPLIHKSGVAGASAGPCPPVPRRVPPGTSATPTHAVTSAKLQRPDKRVLLRMKVAGGTEGERVWSVSSPSSSPARASPPASPACAPALAPAAAPAQTVPSAVAGTTRGAGAGPGAAGARGMLPQFLALFNGRRFIVVPRTILHTAQQHEEKRRGRIANGASPPPAVASAVPPPLGVSAAAACPSPRRRGRPRLDDTDYFTAFYNRAQESNYNVVVQIFQYLGMRELAQCARVCRLWRQLAATPALWRHVRMKNSHVSSWAGLCSALRRHGTKRLDLRKMLLPQNDALFWSQFAENICTVNTLERIEMCRCPSSAVEAVCLGLPGLRALSALAIRDALLDPAPLGTLTLLHELRLKSMAGLSLTRDLAPLGALTRLQHLSLTSIKDLGWCACEVVGSLAALESLELGECSFRADMGSALARLTRLRRVRLERGPAHHAAPPVLRALASLPALVSLELVNVDVKVGFDDALAECKNIQRLLIIPTYVSQSATTNKQVLSGVLRLKETLTHLMWGVTIELLRVTELFIDQCEQSGDAKRRDVGECIPVLKPVPGCKLPDEHHHVAGPPQVEILPLPTLQRLLSAQMPNTKLKLLRIPFHATWRQSLADFQ